MLYATLMLGALRVTRCEWALKQEVKYASDLENCVIPYEYMYTYTN